MTTLLPGMNEYELWECMSCGDHPDPCSSELGAKWRWDGERWQHYHGYPIGHVHCQLASQAELIGQ